MTGRFTGCTFENNTNTTHGGAVACSGSTNYFTDCVFTGNTVTGAKSDGGAIFLQKAGASAEIVNCTFTQNSTTRYGGAISQKNDIATNGVLTIKILPLPKISLRQQKVAVGHCLLGWVMLLLRIALLKVMQ